MWEIILLFCIILIVYRLKNTLVSVIAIRLKTSNYCHKTDDFIYEMIEYLTHLKYDGL